MQEYVHYLYFYIIYADIPCFFSRARLTAGEGKTGNISRRISPLHGFWMAGLDSSI